jgi:hypothetical protein
MSYMPAFLFAIICYYDPICSISWHRPLRRTLVLYLFAQHFTESAICEYAARDIVSRSEAIRGTAVY